MLNTTGGAPGTKRYGIIQTPGENTVNTRAARQEKEEARKKKGSIQSAQTNKKERSGEIPSREAQCTPYAADQGAERGNENK